VDEELLAGSAVRFVGTATIGFEHVDREYLAEHGVAFASAPGSNAVSVAEYVMTALSTLAGRSLAALEGASIGVVGVGNVGSRVARMAPALGLRAVLNDPPRQRAGAQELFRPLDEALACDVVTLHVPLTKTGSDATWHMANEEFFAKMRPGAVFINTSRGGAVDGTALLGALESGKVRAAALDVFEDEPDIDWELARRAAIATPHIAGYSYDGKVRGTQMIYAAACEFAGVRPAWQPQLPPSSVPIMTFVKPRDGQEVLRSAMRAVYDVERDDAALRRGLDLAQEKRAAHFDALRKEYPIRREFHNTTAVLLGGSSGLAERLGTLGFKTRAKTP